MYVYEIINNINQKRYIGITRNIIERFKYHKQRYLLEKEFDKVLYRAFRKYDITNFTFNILYEELSETEAKSIEIELIETLDTLSHAKGYNVTKGGDHRNNQGENNNTTILTELEVLSIIARREAGEIGREVYKDFQQITQSSFQAIWLGINWKHLQPAKIVIVKGNAKLSVVQVREIKTLLAEGVKNKIIQEQFKLSYRDLWRIQKGHTYSNILLS